MLLLLFDSGIPSLALIFKLTKCVNSLGLGLTQTPLFESLTQVWIAFKIDGIHWCAQCLPIKLLNSVHAFEIVLDMGSILFRHNLYLVRLLMIVPRPE